MHGAKTGSVMMWALLLFHEHAFILNQFFNHNWIILKQYF